jgi:hypothetical protein
MSSKAASEVKVVSTEILTGKYRPIVRIIFAKPDGERLKWYASNAQAVRHIRPGMRLRLTYTIKGPSLTDDGTTEITRAKATSEQ